MPSVQPVQTPAKPVLRPQDFHHQTLVVGDLNMHMVIEGPEGAPLVVLLHGFPEFWYSWRHQIKALAEAGFRVAAIDQRGYGLTDKHGPYDVFTLSQDVVNAVHALGYEKAYIVGHDWGGIVAWLVAAFYPQVTERLIVCNCPHLNGYMDTLQAGHLPQIRKSWYIGFFQLPFLPEMLLGANNFQAMARLLELASSQALSAEEIGYYREAWSQLGALSAAVSWYRALVQNLKRVLIRDLFITMPTRLIWGEPDLALEKQTAEASHKHCAQLEIYYIQNSGHFVQQDSPDEVSQLILDFLPQSIR